MSSKSCSNCGTVLAPGARFCSGCGAPATPTASVPRDPSGAIRRGSILEDRYKIINFLGQGGFSRVYGAIDLRLRTPCAIKENSEFDHSAHSQFIAEAQLLARLKHAHLTKVTDYFTDAGDSQFLVMEYVPGVDLEKLMLQSTELLPWRTVVEWGMIVCDVLTYLHENDPPIIHRDIKPANLRLTPEGTLMVIDLGIAKLQKPGSHTTRAAQAYSGGYSPIEQYLGQGTTAQSDLYALGATLYHLLSGTSPIEAPSRLRGVAQPPLETLRGDLPPLLARAIDRAMALEPEHRPPSANALAMVFDRVMGTAEPATVGFSPPPTGIGSRSRTPSRPGTPSQPRAVSQPRPPTQPHTPSQPRVVSQPLIGAAPSTPTYGGMAAQPGGPRAEPLPGSVIWPGDGREMVRVAGGPFTMGVDGGEADEQPAHSVELAAFLIDRFPVSCADYARFIAASNHRPPAYWGGKRPPASIEDHPVVEVTLDDARAYARWAGKRLPTEAEWEKAATWDDSLFAKRRYPWGDSWDADRANGRDGGAGGTIPIGAYAPGGDSPYGAAEMVGNIWEWTASAYKRYPYDPNDGRENPAAGGLRATRGGSWSCSPEALRAANRNVAAASHTDFELGFRCAADDNGEG